MPIMPGYMILAMGTLIVRSYRGACACPEEGGVEGAGQEESWREERQRRSVEQRENGMASDAVRPPLYGDSDSARAGADASDGGGGRR